MARKANRERAARRACYPEYDGMTSDQIMGEKRAINFQVQALGHQLHALRERSEYLKMRLRALRDGEDADSFGISDHAVLRYLERVKGVDMVAVRREIRTRAKRLDIVADAPDQRASDGETVFAISDGTRVTTIWTEKSDAAVEV